MCPAHTRPHLAHRGMESGTGRLAGPCPHIPAMTLMVTKVFCNIESRWSNILSTSNNKIMISPHLLSQHSESCLSTRCSRQTTLQSRDYDKPMLHRGNQSTGTVRQLRGAELGPEPRGTCSLNHCPELPWAGRNEDTCSNPYSHVSRFL